MSCIPSGNRHNALSSDEPKVYQGSYVPEEFIENINVTLRVDNLPYYLTNFVWDRTETEVKTAPIIRTVGYPKIIMRESEVLHTMAMEPALQLLRNPLLASANDEFLKALEDYRKGDYSDCLVKCGSALESVMKIACAKNDWPYQEKDTASPLVRVIIEKTNLAPYFESLLMIVATLRNKISSAHGAGTVTKTVPQHLAQYAINTTATTMLLLAEETKLA